MADAAQSARGSFQDIKQSAADMSSGVRGSMRESRESVEALGDAIGVRLPSAITRTVSGLEGFGPALAAALPFAALAVGAASLIQHLEKMHEEAHKVDQSWAAISGAMQKWGEDSKRELLAVEIETDRLNGDKLKELADTIQQIDMTTLDHLKNSFDGVGKQTDEVFGKMRSGWLMAQLGFGNGIQDVQKMFADAMDKVNADLAKGDKGQLAADLKNASDSMWALASPTYNYVQALRESHHEWTANQVETGEHYQGLLKAHGVLVQMTRELEAQEKIEKQKDSNTARTITPPEVINATDPRVAQERKKDFAAYLETNQQKAQADEKLAEERERMEESVTHYFADEYKKQAALQQQLGAEALRHQIEMSHLQEAAQEESDRQKLALHRASAQQALDEEVKAVQDATAVDVKGYQDQLAQLDRYAEDYEVKKQQLADKITEIEQQSQNQIQKIQDQALQKQQQDITGSYGRMSDTVSRDLGQMLTRHETFAKMVTNLGDQMAQGLVQNAMKAILADDMTKPHDAAAAARKAFLAGEATLPGAAGVILGGTLAAGAFAAVMAFEGGGIVPGVENYDAVPARLMPGEAVLPKSLTEHLMQSKTDTQQHTTHVHVQYAPQIHAMDGPSVDRVLQEHQDTFHRHFESHIRKMNR